MAEAEKIVRLYTHMILPLIYWFARIAECSVMIHRDINSYTHSVDLLYPISRYRLVNFTFRRHDSDN